MDNKFFAFVETYKEELNALYEAIIRFFETLFAKMGE